MRKGQFFIMSIVLLALAMFLLMTYFLAIDESSAIMFEKSSVIDLKNMQNAIKSPGTCDTSSSLCPHFVQIYGGKYSLNCSSFGTAPYDYNITFKSKDFSFIGNFTNDLSCAAGAVCGNGVLEAGEICDSTQGVVCGVDPAHFVDGYVEDGAACNFGATGACDITCNACINCPGGAGG